MSSVVGESWIPAFAGMTRKRAGTLALRRPASHRLPPRAAAPASDERPATSDGPPRASSSSPFRSFGFGVCLGFGASDFGFAAASGLFFLRITGHGARVTPVVSCGGMVGIIVGKIEIREFSPELPGGLIVGSGRVFRLVELAEESGAAPVLDIGDPFLSLSAVGDADVGRGGVGRTAAVGVVLFEGAVAEVVPAVVEAVVVDVVADHVVGSIHDLAVHVNPFGPAVILDMPDRVAPVPPDLAAPAELREPDVVGRIDLRHPVLRQRDLAVGAEHVHADRQTDLRFSIYD